MAGYREFQTGEVLTAANVNSFLMEQATMTFADAAARDAALAGVLREGLLTYNLDTQRLEVYDGTDWVEPAPPQNLVAVKSAIRTSPFSASLAHMTSAAVPDLSITHEVSDPSNGLIIAAFVSGSRQGSRAAFGMAVNDGTGFIGVGDSAPPRVSISSGGMDLGDNRDFVSGFYGVNFVHVPGSGSKTYTVHIFNVGSSTSVGTNTVFVNRGMNDDSNTDRKGRTVSTLVIQEVAL